MGKSWNTPKFDIYDPSLVFYAPLWRPDMVARGGSIVNGTGTMDVNPQALAVGANTITVTGLGTFKVRIPEGGTVASGTTTVSGSPVTVSVGVPTTITTTGSTGNITVTSSNIIRSKDRNNPALTVTGALWTPQGHSFDGIDDFIDCGTSSSLELTTFSLLLWVYLNSVAGNNPLVSKAVDVSNRNYQLWALGANPYIEITEGGALVTKTFANLTIPATAWVHIAFTFKSPTWTAYVSAIPETQTQALVPDQASGSSLYLGRSFGNERIAGKIGEALVESRAFSQSEVQNNMLTTKWKHR